MADGLFEFPCAYPLKVMGLAEPGFADAILAPTFFVAFALLPMFGGRHDLLEGLPKLARWWQAVEADPVSGALKREYDVAFKAFLASRLKAA